MFADSMVSGCRRGSALVIVMILLAVASGLCGAMMIVHVARSKSSFDADMRIARMYAAEAGLERAKFELFREGAWLAANADKGPVVTMILGQFTTQVSVVSEDGTWFTVKSAASRGDGVTTTLSITTRGRTLFSDYARFVSKGILDIGNDATYGGKVHGNSNINVVGSGVVFWEDVTATGKINSRPDTVFKKNATPGVPEIILPGEDQLEGLAKSAPAGALMYDWMDPIFKSRFKTATGVEPTSTLAVSIVLKQDKMDVVSKCGTATMTETGIPVPHGGTIYCRGVPTISGNISRRMSVLSPSDIYIDGAVRYTDDSGGAQWQLKDKVTGLPMPFDAATNSWSCMGQWDGPDYVYQEAPDWLARQPRDFLGNPFSPALGIVTSKAIYISGETPNRELHAALFTSGDVIKPAVSGKKTNLYILGAIITTGTNPVSSWFSYRCYAYDPNLRANPPPGFPGGDLAAFGNWHVVMPEDKAGSKGY